MNEIWAAIHHAAMTPIYVDTVRCPLWLNLFMITIQTLAFFGFRAAWNALPPIMNKPRWAMLTFVGWCFWANLLAAGPKLVDWISKT